MDHDEIPQALSSTGDLPIKMTIGGLRNQPGGSDVPTVRVEDVRTVS